MTATARVARPAANRRPTSSAKAHFGARLREARKGLGFTQKSLAAALGVTVATILNWERGLTSPSSPDMQERLLAALAGQASTDRGVTMVGAVLHELRWCQAGHVAPFAREVMGSNLRPPERLVLLSMAAWARPETGRIPSYGLPSVADLASVTGLAAGAVATIVRDLTAEDWIESVGDTGSGLRFQIAPEPAS